MHSLFLDHERLCCQADLLCLHDMLDVSEYFESFWVMLPCVALIPKLLNFSHSRWPLKTVLNSMNRLDRIYQQEEQQQKHTMYSNS